jgi:WD40 repeat protein
MFRGKPWKLSAIGGIALTLLSVLAIRPGCTSQRGDAAKEERVTILTGHRMPVQALAFSPDGTALTSAACFLGAPGCALEVGVWDVMTGTRRAQRTEQLGGQYGLAFAPGGQRLGVAQGGSLWLWNTAHESDKGQRYEQHVPVCGLAFSDDGGQLAVADFANDVTLVEATSGRPRGRCNGQEEAVYSLAFSPDGAVLASGGRQGTVWLWEAASGERRGVLPGHTKPVLAVAFSPDGRWLASGDLAGVVRLWDVTKRTAWTTLKTSEEEVAVTAVTFAPDSPTLAVAVGRAVQLWDVTTGRLLATLRRHEGQVNCLAYSPDAKWLASGSYDKTVRLWDVTRYRPSLP